MNKSSGSHWLALSAIGGLLASSAFPGHIAIFGLSGVFAYMAYAGYVLQINKRKFLILVVANFFVGVILRFMPHFYTGGLSSIGFLIARSGFIPSLLLLWLMFKSELSCDSSKTGNN